nr:transposase [Corallococcus aberystwythensis]
MQPVEADPRHLGFAFAHWTCGRLAAYLKARTGVEVSAWWVGELLRCHGFAWRRAKLTSRHLADEEEKSARPKAPQLPAENGSESRSGLRAVVRRRRPLRPAARHALHVEEEGQPPVATHSGQERAGRRGGRTSLPGPALPLHAPAGPSHLEPLPTAAREAGSARQAHGRRIVLVLDNGNTFTACRAQAALEQAAPWVRPFWLPRYTSETLNWIEGYWEHLKDIYFSQMLTEEREAFYPDAIRLLHRLQQTGRLQALAPCTTL